METKIMKQYEDIMKQKIENAKEKEDAIMQLGDYFRKHNYSTELGELIKMAKHIIKDLSKAKAAKLIKMLIDNYLDIDVKNSDAIGLIKDCIEWTVSEKRNYLRQTLESKLMKVYYENERYEEALVLGSALLKELKKLEDKGLLVEVQLLESKIYYRLSNLQRSRAALTSSRTTANGIYCQPRTQAALDLQSGILHAADERDFKTAYSYFYEAFEGYNSVEEAVLATKALKYMLMCKIMLNLSEEVPHILAGGKLSVKYCDRPDIIAMREIAEAARERSLSRYISIVEQYRDLMSVDPVVARPLHSLYDRLLGENLEKIIQLYSRVQLEYLAERIELPRDVVERKLSQMILDKKLAGILNQKEGVLIVYDKTEPDNSYETALDIIHSLSDVVDQLYHKAKKLA